MYNKKLKRKTRIIFFVVLTISIIFAVIIYKYEKKEKEDLLKQVEAAIEPEKNLYEVGQPDEKGTSLIYTLSDRLDEVNIENMIIADNWKSNGVFYSTWRKENVVFENGIMSLLVNHDQEQGETPWSSAEYFTKDFTQYGEYRVRMKPIKNNGVISSFFVYTGPGYGYPWDEIDIEFLGKDTTIVQFNYYTNGEGKHEYIYELGFDASEEFHTYGFIWEKDYIAWTVDDQEVYRATENIPSNPAKIMMNTWVTQGVDGWTGKFDGNVPLAAKYDWIEYKAIEVEK